MFWEIYNYTCTSICYTLYCHITLPSSGFIEDYVLHHGLCTALFISVEFIFNIHRNKGPPPTSLYDVAIRPRDVVGKWSTPIMSQTPRSNSYEDYFKEINDIASSTDGENEEEEVTKTPDGKMWRGRGRVGITQIQ